MVGFGRPPYPRSMTWGSASADRSIIASSFFPSGTKRHEGNGRSDAVRLLTRETLRRVRTASRGMPPALHLHFRVAAGSGCRKRDEPPVGCGMQQARGPSRRANRQGGEIPRRRNMIRHLAAPDRRGFGPGSGCVLGVLTEGWPNLTRGGVAFGRYRRSRERSEGEEKVMRAVFSPLRRREPRQIRESPKARLATAKGHGGV